MLASLSFLSISQIIIREGLNSDDLIIRNGVGDELILELPKIWKHLLFDALDAEASESLRVVK